MYTTWSRIIQDSQDKQAKVCNWASHLEHPQSIGFYADKAPENLISIDFFKKGIELVRKKEFQLQRLIQKVRPLVYTLRHSVLIRRPAPLRSMLTLLR